MISGADGRLIAGFVGIVVSLKNRRAFLSRQLKPVLLKYDPEWLIPLTVLDATISNHISCRFR